MVLVPENPFTPMRLEEDRAKDTSRTLNIRLNADEEKMLTELKDIFDTDQDGAALKLAAEVGLNVLHNTFSPPVLKWLFKKNRVRRTP